MKALIITKDRQEITLDLDEEMSLVDAVAFIRHSVEGEPLAASLIVNGWINPIHLNVSID